MTDEKVGAIMVVGGGISGMQSALDLADSGYRVYLVEKNPTIGGVMAQLDKTFPTNDCSMCIMAPKLVATGRHHNIHVIPNSEITKVDGEAGNFRVTLRTRPRWIDPEACTGCGLCAQYCPVTSDNEYNEGLMDRRAIYLDYAQAIPLLYQIDREVCIGCGTCESLCQANAIKYDDSEEDVSLDVGSIILSPGFGKFDAALKPEFGYGNYRNVVTSMELERMLSATGPSGGVVIRPSDGDIPERIAFLQCIGSRDEKAGNPYCSSVCCMYSIKEAMIAQEHAEGMKPTIFYMDLRAYGKEFEKYYIRAQDEYGMRFLRSRVASVDEDPDTNNLIIHYVDENNKHVTEEFDMVVLAIGLTPPEDAAKLAETLGIELNEHGFCDTSTFGPIDSSREGIYVAGAFAGPKDIPETVANASGAAARASSVVASERGKLVREKEYPEEKAVAEEDEPRIGVFVCHCGINIGSVVDVPDVVEYASGLENVVFADRNLYTCSQDTQDRIRDKIKEHDLNRVIVASCTPRTHEPLFMNTCKEAGLNPYLFEFVNLREHCSWVHMNEKDRATEKAQDLVRIGVSKARLHTPLYPSYLDITKSGLVIGGGVAGMTAALGLAEQGFPVHLIEKEEVLGGLMRRIHILPRGEEDPQEKVQELISRVKSHENVTVHLKTDIKEIQGSVGDFKTTIETDDGEETIEHGVVVVAIGGKEYEPREYHYGDSPRILTQLELEEKLVRGEIEGKTFVVIQCVGARNEEWQNCSRICCTEALKNTVALKEKVPDAEIFVLNKDIRSYGFHEDLYRTARGQGVHFVTYTDEKKPEVTVEGDDLKVVFDDPILQKKASVRPDYVVLSVAARPPDDVDRISKMLKVSTTEDGYFFEAHMKLRPVDFATEGVFLAGLAHGPKLVDEAISQANAAVSRATTVLSKDKMELEPIKSHVVEENCDGCAFCVDPCPYDAITLIEYMRQGDIKKTIQVDTSACKGCGVCMATCPKEGIYVRRFRLDQLKAMVNAALEVL